jgi:hypothetical protein
LFHGIAKPSNEARDESLLAGDLTNDNVRNYQPLLRFHADARLHHSPTRFTMIASSKRVLLSMLAAMVVAVPAYAAPITLSCEVGCSNVAFGDAIWSTELTFHPSGTGVFQPFLRLHALGRSTIEDGHNTDARSQDFLNDEMGGIWTHAVALSAFTPFIIDGVEYFGFALDTGEPAAKKKSPLSLDALKICTSNNPSLTKADDCPSDPYKYDLDAGADREVLLDYNLIGRGNGESDLFIFIPAFATTDTYLYLYSKLGGKGGPYQVDGTFSEWSFFDAPSVVAVPEPASLLLLATGIVGVLARRRN